jgi:putative DNA primase/helicase
MNVFLLGWGGYSITDILKTEIFRGEHQWNTHLNTINLLNGELSLSAEGLWELKPHVREHYRTTQLPLEFNPTATAPRFTKFLKEIFSFKEPNIIIYNITQKTF